jgi:hypothetical protein
MSNKRVLNIKKGYGFVLLVALAYYLHHLLTYNLGINYEEGRDANAYLLFLKGFLPYRDFEWIYGPFSFFVYPFVMKIFGAKLIVLRLAYIFFGSLIIPLVYSLAKRIIMPYQAAIAAFLSIIFLNTPFYTFNHVFAVIGEIGCLLFLCKFIENKKHANLFVAGLFCSLTVLTKPLLPGLALFLTAVLFLLFIYDKDRFTNKIKFTLFFSLSTFIPLFSYAIYFISQTFAKHAPILYPPFFSRTSIGMIEQAPRVNLDNFLNLFRRIFMVCPLSDLSKTGLKLFVIRSFEGFIASLYIFIVLIFAFLVLKGKGSKLAKELAKDKTYLQLFIVFSVFISFENLLITHMYGKAYNTQVTFILAVYLLFKLKGVFFKPGLAGNVLVFIILFGVSFLNFFRYPVSMLKRNTKPIPLVRAVGVLVSPKEAEFYGSLGAYLGENLNNNDKMAVLNYLPHLSFSTGKEDIFSDEGFIFEKLFVLNERSKVKPDYLLSEFEDKIINRLENEKPKVILIAKLVLNEKYAGLTSKVRDFVDRRYIFDKKIGPVDIFGNGGSPGFLNCYKIKNQ